MGLFLKRHRIKIYYTRSMSGAALWRMLFNIDRPFNVESGINPICRGIHKVSSIHYSEFEGE